MVNFVGNSLKFTKNGIIEIEVEVFVNYFSVMVSDTGSGINAKNIEFLGQEFKTFDND